MKLKQILLPIDFSTGGEKALELATLLAAAAGARILIVHVAEASVAYGVGHNYYGVFEPSHEQLLEMLHRVVPKDPEVTFEHHLLEGNPAHALLAFADSRSVDMIVIGTHGRTGLSRVLMGSVTEEVVRQAKCPVVTIKHPSHPSKQKG